MIEVGASSIRCQARAVANQTITTANSWTAVALGAEDYDTADAHSTTSNSARFYAPRTDLYRVRAHLLWNASGTAGTQRSVRVTKNGVGVPGAVGWQPYTSSNTASYLVVPMPTIDVNLVAGDYVELQAFTVSANQVLYGDADMGSMLHVESIR